MSFSHNLITYLHSLIINFLNYIDDKPDKLCVLKWLVDIDASWRGIGLDLGISNNYLEALAQSSMSNQMKLDHVLQKWIEMDSEATPVIWKVIIDVIKGPLVQNKALAMEIYKSLKQESSNQQNTTGMYKYICVIW